MIRAERYGGGLRWHCTKCCKNGSTIQWTNGKPPEFCEPCEKKQGAYMYQKGYRYRIIFADGSGLDPLYVKSIQNLSELMRRDYTSQKDWHGHRITQDGSRDMRCCKFTENTERTE